MSSGRRPHRRPGLFVILAAAGLISCTGEQRAARRQSADRTPAADVLSAERIAAERGIWNRHEVEKRLTEAGLVVADSVQLARHPQLARDGERIWVSGAPLELYIYDDSEARRTAAAMLDTADHSPTGAPAPLRRRYIIVNNMVAVLRTRSGRLAERVELALTARHTGN